jgi:hypothetical protein
VVWYLRSALFLSHFAQELLVFVERGGSYPRLGGPFFFFVDLLMGIWAMWLYAAIAPRYGAGPKTAAITGVAWWTIKTLQSAKWAGLGLIPRKAALMPLATTMVAVLAASVLGAWLYDRTDGPAS